jgi:hypothetical protein
VDVSIINDYGQNESKTVCKHGFLSQEYHHQTEAARNILNCLSTKQKVTNFVSGGIYQEKGSTFKEVTVKVKSTNTNDS